MSDYKGAALLLPVLPDAQELIADRGYDADWFRRALEIRNIKPCIPPRKGRTAQIPFDRQTYRLRHKIENLFAKLKDWRRIATRYDRCAHTFFSAICIAATVIFYLT
jgi:transposase